MRNGGKTKRNPQGTVTGIDRWGAEYASFSKKLCEDNSKAEGVAERTAFAQGDALRLEYPDGAFDAVTSNYVYHNIPSRDWQGSSDIPSCGQLRPQVL